MYYRNNLKLISQWAIKLLSVILLITVFSCPLARAQYRSYGGYGGSDSQYGISVGADYDAPIGNLGYSYKPAINYNLNVLRNTGNFTTSISFGYHVYKPKLDTFYYAATDADYGTEVLQNFTVISLYLGAVYNYPLTDQFKIYGGLNLGVYNTHYKVQTTDFIEDDNEDISEQDAYLAGRLGFTYMATENIGIGLEAKYNFFAPTGDAQYNDHVGTLYNSYSAGIRLTYMF